MVTENETWTEELECKKKNFKAIKQGSKRYEGQEVKLLLARKVF